MRVGEVRISHLRPVQVAFLNHVGRYREIPYGKMIERLYAWAGRRGLRPSGPPMAAFYDDPERVPPEKCRAEVMVPVEGTAEPDLDVGLRVLPAMEVAAIDYRGPPGETGAVHHAVMAEMQRRGRTRAGPIYEVYLRPPEPLAGGKLLVTAELRVPLAGPARHPASLPPTA